MDMGKQEKLAWLVFALSAAGALYLGWVLFDPTNGLDEDGFERARMHAYYLCWIFGGVGAWVRRQSGPLQDERDRQINAKALESGYGALMLMLVVVTAIIGLDDYTTVIRSRIPGWTETLMLFCIAASVLVYSLVRLTMYWRDRQ
ncbi:MAG: hypothetical protein QM599_04270 [Pseudoxanthomonas sp.]